MVLDGKQFAAYEIQAVLALAANDAINQWNTTNDDSWLSANVNIASTKVKVNALATLDEETLNRDGVPPMYKKGDPLWAEVDAVLTPVADFDDVSQAVSDLQSDVAPLAAAPSWARPALVGGGLAAVVALGYWWANKGTRRRR